MLVVRKKPTCETRHSQKKVRLTQYTYEQYVIIWNRERAQTFNTRLLVRNAIKFLGGI